MISIGFLIGLALGGDGAIRGTATAGDGDSFRIGASRYRLFGIDAPELHQTCSRAGATWPCGREASQQLALLITGRELSCVGKGTDAFGRVLAKCTVAGVDVNRSMVASGYAVAFRRYSTEYVSAEETARSNRRGLWAGTFDMPSEVRAAGRRPAAELPGPARATTLRRTAAREATRCAIKGNHSRRGEWIYHVPGMPYYHQTRPEAVFCSEADARAAGYRRAKVR